LHREEGYWTVGLRKVRSTSVRTHRIIIALTKGKWPDDQVDHRDRNRAANRSENLREATNAQNQQNRNIGRNNTSGFTGVSWHNHHRKWRALIWVGGRRLHLGFFTNILHAILIREWAEQEFHPFRESPKPFDPASVPPGTKIVVVTAAERWKHGVRGAWRLPPRIHFRP
jgi:hypothetical protein